MKRRAFFLVATMGLLVAGCIPTLQPIYNDSDLVFEKLLLGTWQPDNENSTWKFVADGDKAYRFVFTDQRGKTGEFEAHLARFDGLTYLDLQPTDKGIEGNDFYKTYLLPLHTFFRVDELTEDMLQLSAVDGEWLKQQLQENPKALKHEWVDDGLLLTAPPDQLQDFLKRHNETSEAFSKTSTLRRCKAKSSAE